MRVLSTLALALVGAVIGLAPRPALASFPGANGRIAFDYRDSAEPDRPQVDELRTIAPDGSDEATLRTCRHTPVSTGPQVAVGDCDAYNLDPAFSPDGSRLVFGLGQIAIAGLDGSRTQVLPLTSLQDREPGWSPGGSRIVFSALREEGGLRADLFLVDPSGASLYRLTFRGGAEPDWSTRQRIVFTRNAGGFDSGQPDLFVVRPDGRSLRRLTSRGGSQAVWSPRGNVLAFVRKGDVYTVAANRTRLRRLTFRAGDSPAWAPDGRSIAFLRRGALYTIRTDGSHLRQLRAAPPRGFFGNLTWQPVR